MTGSAPGGAGLHASGVPTTGLPLGTLADGVVARVRADGAIECLDGRGAVEAVVHWWVGAEDRWRCATGAAALRPVAVDATPVYELALRVPGGDVRCRLGATRVGSRPVVAVRFRNESAVPVGLAVEIERRRSQWTVVADRAWRAAATGESRSGVDPGSGAPGSHAPFAITSAADAMTPALPDGGFVIGVVPLPHSPTASRSEPDAVPESGGSSVPDPAVRCVIGLSSGRDAEVFAESVAPDAIARGWRSQRRAGGDIRPPDDQLAGVVGLSSCLAQLPGERDGTASHSLWHETVDAVAGNVGSAVRSVRSMSARQWRQAPPDAVIMLAWSLVAAGWDRSEWDLVIGHVGPAARRLCRRARGATGDETARVVELVALAVALADLAGDPATAQRIAVAGSSLQGSSGQGSSGQGSSGQGASVRPARSLTRMFGSRTGLGDSVSVASNAPPDVSTAERARVAVAGGAVRWQWISALADRFDGAPSASLDDAAPVAALGRLASVRSRAGVIELWPSWPSEWNGRPAEVHNVGTPWGRVSAALRWHGNRPAVLWEVDEWGDGRVVHPPRLRFPVIDPGADLVGWKGESFLAEPADVSPIPVTIGLGAPVRRGPRR